jgi:tetratricopeptide (TPR) repeat protein
MLSALNDGSARSKLLLTRLSEQPKSPAMIGAAEVLCAQGHYSEAITRLRSVAEFYSDIYRYNLVLARAYRDSGNIELAKQHYEKACQIAPQNEVAIKELIALTAFPQSVPKPVSHSLKREANQPVATPAPKTPEPETPTTFKLDRDKLLKILGGVVGSAEKSDTPLIETQKPASSPSTIPASAVEAFRQTDSLLEQEPDIDALAREMMGLTALPESPPNLTVHESSENLLTKIEPKNAPPQQVESKANVAPIQQSTSGTSVSDIPVAPTSTPQNKTLATPSSIPLDEKGNPIINIDRNKLIEALSGLHKTKGVVPSATHAEKPDDEETLSPMSTPTSSSSAPEPPPMELTAPSHTLSFEEELMAMQMQGSGTDAFVADKETAHHNKATTTSPSTSSQEYDLDALAREVMNAQMPKVIETNDPTPIDEQRKPFSDDEEIKTPTRQLAKIFQSQGAYAKAIKVYEMLAEREPENASLYEILIDTLREKLTASK